MQILKRLRFLSAAIAVAASLVMVPTKALAASVSPNVTCFSSGTTLSYSPLGGGIGWFSSGMHSFTWNGSSSCEEIKVRFAIYNAGSNLDTSYWGDCWLAQYTTSNVFVANTVTKVVHWNNSSTYVVLQSGLAAPMHWKIMCDSQGTYINDDGSTVVMTYYY